ncbi:hypothetical protein PNOK_0409100 [Pyrrhoderma noxium]|uniref:DUF6533 domain-containing protein n=1 Tax=Pyrrhoderma noxium TaxID=2282107 RepID=A0A286UPM1_9AGAM|nr:hypothetical protein PNOK_0409100 [Pyrrhoderma noxium]
MSDEASVHAVVLSATHLRAAKSYALAAFTMMVYDITITFSQEVEKVWKRRFSGLTILWFLNRWIFFLATIPTLFSFHDPRWTDKPIQLTNLPPFVGDSRCEAYFRYPGIVAAFQRLFIGSVFMLRTYAIYGRSLVAAGIIALFLIAEFVTKLVINFKFGSAVQLPKGMVGCILAVDDAHSKDFSWFYTTELMTDFVVLVLTVTRSYKEFRRVRRVGEPARLWRVILKDGIIYFLLIFSANVMTLVFFLAMPSDLKAINASFIVMFNSLLTARLILNLKSVSTREGSRGVSTAAATGGTTSRWEAAVLGDVGNDFEDDDRLGKMGFADPESSGLSGLSETTTLVHRNSGYDDGMAFEMTNRNRPNSGSSLPVYSPLDSPYTQSDISSKDPNGL